MSFTPNQIANIERVGYLSTIKASLPLHLMEIRDLIGALQLEMGTFETDTEVELARIYWDCYCIMDKRCERMEDTGKREGSVTLPLSHWFSLYKFLLYFEYPTNQTDSLLGKIDKLRHKHERKGSIYQLTRISKY